MYFFTYPYKLVQCHTVLTVSAVQRAFAQSAFLEHFVYTDIRNAETLGQMQRAQRRAVLGNGEQGIVRNRVFGTNYLQCVQVFTKQDNCFDVLVMGVGQSNCMNQRTVGCHFF